MKGLVTLGVIGLLGIGCTWWLMAKMNEDPGVPIMLAVGKPENGTAAVHACVQPGLSAHERPRVDIRGTVYWQEWVDDHLKLRSDSGDEVPLRWTTGSSLISDTRAGGLPDGYVVCSAKANTGYTFYYIPKKAESTHYRHKFRTDSDKIARETFALAK